MNYNRVILGGRLTRDIETRHAGGSSVANFGLAVSRKFKANDGSQKEEKLFVDCEAWGKTGEVMAQYLRKGRAVLIEGSLKLEQWEKDGQKHSKIKVRVDSFQFGDSAKEDKPSGQAEAAPINHGTVGDEDIPF